MKELLAMRGIITVLNTPFTDDNSVDLRCLRKNVSNAFNAGVAGFLVPAMASEVGKLSDSERDRMVQAVLEKTRDRIPVIGGASAPDTETRTRVARNLIQMGCQGILVSIPYADDSRYESDVRDIAALNPDFLMLQDWDASGYGVPVPLIARLFQEIDCFRCLKIEVVPAGRKYSEVLAATDGRLHVSGGWAVMQMIEALDRGVHAFMPTGMHRIYTAIFSLYQNGRRDEARALFNRLLPVLAFSNQHLDISIHFFKRLLWKQGVYPTPNVRQPILPFDEHHRRTADQLIKLVISLEEEVARES